MAANVKVALFLPCYIDQLYPKVGMATVRLLEHYDVSVDFPTEQTCCGQPFSNMGCVDEVKPLAEKFLKVFGEYDYVVCPSGSCTSMVRKHYEEYIEAEPLENLTRKVYELCEFMTDVLKVDHIDKSFPHKVGVHQSCHGLRELRLGQSSEINAPTTSVDKVGSLLSMVKDIELMPLNRADECCGFGGTFAVKEEKISCQMGHDRLNDHEEAGAEIITGADMSCLMHLDGLSRRKKKAFKVMHVAEILAP